MAIQRELCCGFLSNCNECDCTDNFAFDYEQNRIIKCMTMDKIRYLYWDIQNKIFHEYTEYLAAYESEMYSYEYFQFKSLLK